VHNGVDVAQNRRPVGVVSHIAYFGPFNITSQVLGRIEVAHDSAYSKPPLRQRGYHGPAHETIGTCDQNRHDRFLLMETSSNSQAIVGETLHQTVAA
jgi:hypothetical protein